MKMRVVRVPCVVVVCLLASAALVSAAEAACPTVVEVCAVPNNPTASGDALLAAVSGITGASWGNRYLVKIGPGVFNVGTTTLQMVEWVDIEGSGREQTVIQGLGSIHGRPSMGDSDPAEGRASEFPGVIRGANHAELRDLQITAYGVKGIENPIAILTEDTTPRLSNLRIVAFGGAQCWGIRTYGGVGIDIDNIDVSASCTGYNSGVTAKIGTSGPARINLQHATIQSLGGNGQDVGVFLDNGAMPLRFEDVKISAGTEGAGVMLDNFHGYFDDQLEIVDSTITTAGGKGIWAVVPVTIKVVRSKVDLSRVGILYDSAVAPGVVFIDQSTVAGSDNTISGSYYALSHVYVGASQLAGGPVSATGAVLHCGGVYDENYVFSTRTCP